MYTGLEQAIIKYEVENDCLNLIGGGEVDPETLQYYVNAVKCFQQHDELGEFSVPQILNKFVGVWDKRDEYIEEMLIENEVENQLHSIGIPTPNGKFPMFLECLDYDKIWETMSQMETALKGYKWNDPNDEDSDHRFYVYDMTK